MIIGSIRVENGAVITNKDSFLLSSLSVVSVRRPFLVPALLLSGLICGYGLAFIDLMHPAEIVTIFGVSTLSVYIAAQIGQLKLLSRDLRGSPLGDVLWGQYASLQAVRAEIVTHLNAQKGASHDTA